MASRTLETDYLVLGSGAAGMAFADSLITETDDQVVMVDRRPTPGGHWNDAYCFVRLHQPSMYYGVNSTPLDGEAVRSHGREGGMYGRASGAEILAYYDRVMNERLIPSDRVRFFPQCEYVGDHRFVSRLTGDTFDVRVRKRVVDAAYLSPSVPATTPPPFETGEGASVVPVTRLGALAETPDRYVIIGAGKTAMDACVWLLDNGVDPERIRWLKPRESWLLNRSYAQPGEFVGKLLDGIALQMESAARAESAQDLFDLLEATEQFRRVDRTVPPTMYRGATIGDWELDALRRIRDVHRIGHVRRVERDRIVGDGARSTRRRATCTSTARRRASGDRRRAPSSSGIASRCSPFASASSRSTQRSQRSSRRTGRTMPRRTSCARRTRTPRPRWTGRGGSSSRCAPNASGRGTRR